jgi:hypothetical protein
VPDVIKNANLIRYGFIATFTCILLAGTCAPSPAAGARPAAAEASINPVELVRAAVANEVAANEASGIKHMFRSFKQTSQGSTTRLYVETKEAMAGLTIAYNNKPLSPDQLQGEENRLAVLAGSSEQLRHKHAQEQENADRTMRILKALPDAFLYTYDGEERGNDQFGKSGATLVRLKFRPNPAYQSPSHTEQVLEGMEGVVAIDPSERRIAQIDGTLFKEVGFGWGILGHLDKGGHFLIEQRDVGDDSWEISRMSLSFTGKILLVKSLSIKSDEVFTNFQRVPNTTTFAQGVKMLETEQAKLAQNREPGTAGPRSH